MRASLSDADRVAISTAVATAEAASAGEIVTVLAERSDGYSDVALAWAAAVAFLTLAAMALTPGFWLGLYDRLSGNWTTQPSPGQLFAIAGGVATVAFLAMVALQLWQPLRVALVPPPIRHERVRARAVAYFRLGAEQRTTGRTGVLIYLSWRERRAEIVADSAIAALVPVEVWGEAMAALLAEVRLGRVAAGLCAAVARVGAVLARHVPRQDDDVNELPDRVIEV